MTIQDFIKEKGIVGVIKQKISNKNMRKYIGRFKYIEVSELWYDNPDNPNFNNWIDIEGIGYGWLWLKYKNSKKLQKKIIIKHVMKLYVGSKSKMCIRNKNNIVDIFLENKEGNCIFHIRVSNNELDCL